MHRKLQHVSVWLNHLQEATGTSKNQRYRCTVSYIQICVLMHLNILTIYRAAGFWKYRMLPENGLRKTETRWSLQCIYMIFNFLIILKVCNITLF
jgi:hypothetical protein